ncbi:MAG: hypothetical protein IJL57_01055 [Bacteroidales bacterium]|nr:hypothetical protein [Bacteroidales bacterium]
MYFSNIHTEKDVAGGRLLHLFLFFAAVFVFLSPENIVAQRSKPVYQTDFSSKDYVDTAAPMIWLDAHLAYHFPVGDLHKMFKNNFAVGPGFTFKSRSNWTVGFHFDYMFNANMRDPNFFNGTLANEQGTVIDGNGLVSHGGITAEGRYWAAMADFGKIIPVDRWKNSGIWLRLGAGYFSHRLRLNDYSNQYPQLDGDYARGYDRRSGGFVLSQFIGYQFVRKNRMLNFFIGVEFHEMWTRPNRNYVFFEGPTGDMPYKFSGLVGFKAGWNIPLYERKTTTTFYYR